jgi:hypothetical protein
MTIHGQIAEVLKKELIAYQTNKKSRRPYIPGVAQPPLITRRRDRLKIPVAVDFALHRCLGK